MVCGFGASICGCCCAGAFVWSCCVWLWQLFQTPKLSNTSPKTPARISFCFQVKRSRGLCCCAAACTYQPYGGGYPGWGCGCCGPGCCCCCSLTTWSP